MSPHKQSQVGPDRPREESPEPSLPSEILADQAVSGPQIPALLAGEDDLVDGQHHESAWYTARFGGSAEGPFSRESLERRVAIGDLLVNDLVWSPGLPRWLPVGEVSGLRPMRAGDVRLPGLPWEERRDLETILRLSVRKRLGPASLRLFGRVAAAFACVTLPLMFWQLVWFNGAVSLLVIFSLCEAAAAILERLESLSTFLYHQPPSSQDTKNREHRGD